MKRTLLSLLAAWLLATAALAEAAELEPLLVVSVAPLDELNGDLHELGALLNSPQFTSLLAGALQAKTGVERLDGLDRRRPAGAVISTDGLIVAPVLFFPVDDLAAFLASLEPLIGPAQPASPGCWKLGSGTLTGFVQEKAGWAFVGQSLDALRTLPEPEKVLGDLPTRYDVALRVFPPRIPEAIATMAVDQLRLERREPLDQRPGESPARSALRRRLEEQKFLAIEQLLVNTSELTLGAALERPARRARLELLFTPLPQSSLAAYLAALKPTSSPLAAIGTEDSALALRAALDLPRDETGPLAADLQLLRNALLDSFPHPPEADAGGQRQALAELSAALGDLLSVAGQRGQLDLALALEGRGPPWTLVAAARLEQKESLQKLLERLAELAERDVRLGEVRIEAARIDGIAVHAVRLAALDQPPHLPALFGRDPTLYLAITPQILVAACGKNALPALERSLRPHQAKLPPLELSLKLGTIAALAARLTDNTHLQPVLALSALAMQGPDYRLTATLRPENHALRADVVAQEGVLRAAALALEQAAIRAVSEQQPAGE